MRPIIGLLLLCFVFGPWRPPPAAHAAAPTATEHPEQWRVFEITLTSALPYANPFTDVTVTAVFTGASGLTLTRPAFWDGGDTWKVRVAFPELGRWAYAISASDPANTGLNTRPVAVRVVPYSGPLPIYQHGFLRVSASGRYLEHADGRPFFWLGDTHWFFDNKERWGESNDPRWPSQFHALVDRRVAQGYSVYQSVIFGPGGSLWAPGEVGTRIDPAYFRAALDPKMAYLAEQGLVHALGLGFHVNIDGQAETLARLAQYVVARYGAYPMVWITGGEVGGNEPEQRDERLAGWRQVALAIDAADTYHQPQTAHYTNDFPTYYQGEHWFDFTMMQGGHRSVPIDSLYYQRYYQAAPAVPFLESEANYEGFSPLYTEDLVRATAYRAIQSGSLGYTYGAQGIWNAAWDAADTANDFVETHWNWNEAIDFLGGQQMAYLGRFYRRLPWATLLPRPQGWAEYPPQPVDANRPVVTADTAARNVVVYLPEGYTALGAGLNVINLANQTYAIRWYNPRTGDWLYQGRARLGLGQWRLEPAPAGEDWLVWLTAVATPPAERDLARAAAQPNLAAGRTYSSSSAADASQAAAQAFDGDPQTYWQPAAGAPDEAWVEVDFGQAVTFNSAVLREDDHRTRAFRLEVWDGAGWVTAYSGTLIGHFEPRLVRFAAQTTTRVRLVFMQTLQTPILREWALYQLADFRQTRATWHR